MPAPVLPGRICGPHVIDAIAEAVQAGGMKQRHVVIVAFPGFQPLDAVGPFEVFSGATLAAEVLGRPGGYRVTLASSGWPNRSGPASGLGLCTSALPGTDAASTPSSSPVATACRSARHDEALCRGSRPTAPRCRRVATVCTGAFLAAAGRPARRPTGHHPLGAGRAIGHGVPRPRGRLGSDLHPGREVLDERGGHRRHRSGPRPRAGRPRGGRGPDRGSASRDVPPPTRVARPSSPRRCGCHVPNAPPSVPCRTWSKPRPEGITASPTWRPPRP